jgi:hypothetical protein
MAYYIFLKSLRILEEFRKKILVLKFLLNLPVQISKALVNSKIQFLFRKGFLFSFGPVGPAAPPAYPAFRPSWSYLPNSAQQLTRPLLPTETSVVAVPVSRRRSSTTRAAMAALPPNASPPPPPLLLGHYFPPSSHALTHRDEPEITQPLNTTASPAVTPPSPPRCPSPSPIKGPPALTEHSHTISLSPPPLCRARITAASSRSPAAGAPPPRRLPSLGTRQN